ncbi:hypothetical protein, partial [Bacteroides heparinolyticus]|uniref:hypothetical protein n=1 Tax=Prevotella heparinolytica TaxID=28113 RepID=UPI0035A0EC41
EGGYFPGYAGLRRLGGRETFTPAALPLPDRSKPFSRQGQVSKPTDTCAQRDRHKCLSRQRQASNRPWIND